MNAIDDVWRDLVFTVRLLRKSPIFTTAIVLTLALGVGVNTAVFSVVNAIIFRPLPVRDGDRLVVIASQQASSPRLGAVSFPDLQDYRTAGASVFEDVAAYSVGFVGLASDAARAERVLVSWVTGNYFPLLDLRPAHGRLIRADEGRRGRVDPVVVLGHSTWQRRFRGDPSVVGTVVRVNGQPCTIVGVAPAGFSGTFAFAEPELYLPLNWRDGGGLDNREQRNLHAIGRLLPGVSFEDAQTAMTIAASRLAREYPDSNRNTGISVLPERRARPEEDQFRTNAVGAAMMLAMVSLVMIVATINVTNLVLARATSRRQEFATRAALGAGRARLVEQVVTESMILAALGAGVGLLLGAGAARAIAAVRLPGDLPVRFDFHVDGSVLAYTALMTVVCGLLIALVPALRASGGRLHPTWGAQSDFVTMGRPRAVMVVSQIALSFVLLVAAGLFTRSWLEAERADLGFRPEHVLNVHMDVEQLGYTETEGRLLFDELARRVQALPGVETLSYAFTIPMGYIRIGDRVEPEDHTLDTSDRLSAGKNIVSPHYFQTMGIPLSQGRTFIETDDQQSRPVAIVNQRFADALWPGRNPSGLRFRLDPKAHWIEVIGVAPTGRYEYVFEDPQPYFYLPIAQEYTGLRVLQVKTSMNPEALIPSVERIIRAYEPRLPLYDVQSMSQALGSGLGFFPLRVGAVAIATLGLLALALAVIGLYGLISYLTSQRTREIGIRIAIGASHTDVVRLVLENSATLVAVGLAAGVLMTLASSRLIERFLFGVSARDPLTLMSMAPLFAGLSLLACAVPAWRAAHLDPTVALRSE